jgi:rare lipoprotein A
MGRNIKESRRPAEQFMIQRLTAAHPSLPFGSKIKVTNLANRKSVEVEITDRGRPSSGDRIIDLSQAAAKALDMIESGSATVRLELLSGQ